MENDNEKFKNFFTIDFPENHSAVYIICFMKQNKEIPFYVGQTDRLWGRMRDYKIANFKAQTDFKVGIAIKYLQQKGYNIVIKYKTTLVNQRIYEEKIFIEDLKGNGIKLLNELSGYNYKTADKTREKEKIERFCGILLNQ